MPATSGADPGNQVGHVQPGVLQSEYMGGYLALWCCAFSVFAEFFCHVWLQVFHSAAALGGWTWLICLATFPHLIAISRAISSKALFIVAPLLTPVLVSFAGIYLAERCVPEIKSAGGDLILNVASGYYVGCTIPIVVISLAGPLVRMFQETAGHREKVLSRQSAIGTERDVDQSRDG